MGLQPAWRGCVLQTQGVAMGLNQLAFQAVRNNGLKAQLNSTRGNASGVWRGNTRANDVATSKYGVVTHFPYMVVIISISAPTVVENPVGGLT